MSAAPRVDRRPRVAMWAVIAAAGLLLVVLLARGWGDGAWGAAAGLLLLGCFGSCAWALLLRRRTEREVRRATDRLAETRQHQKETT